MSRLPSLCTGNHEGESEEGCEEQEDPHQDVSAENSGVINRDDIWWSLSNVGGGNFKSIRNKAPWL